MTSPARGDIAVHRAAMPHGTTVILDTRSLAMDHRRLAELLVPGLAVLDVGCGTGAITRGIAEAVGPGGQVVGIDVNAGFIDEARRRHAGVRHLSFDVADVRALRRSATFDVVNASRVLQWLAQPQTALDAMVAATRPGGRVVVLDYNHEKIVWGPTPPASMLRFYDAFRSWRAEAGMDNAIADHLAARFADAGLESIVVSAEHETTRRGEPDFAIRAGIWTDVAATRGHQMVADGAIDEVTRARAETEYRRWIAGSAQSQTMYLLAVDGRRPDDHRELGRL
jgi:SAM-dependent methyltransferase